MSKLYAVVVGVEDYHAPQLKKVKYAAADATEFVSFLTESLKVPKDNISLLLNQDAHKSNIEEVIEASINALDADDTFYFFYAGHGLWAGGSNRLTTWDTKLDALPATTIDVQAKILNPLGKSNCKRSILFVDACAQEMFVDENARDMVSDLRPKEFEKFIEKSIYTAAFFACSAMQKSLSTAALGHGIWTYHLLRALRGMEKKAIVKDEWVTGESLRDYLSDAIPRYLREKTEFTAQQKPYALIGSDGTFHIVKIEKSKKADADLQLNVDFSGAFFRSKKTVPFRRLGKFSKASGHTVPTAFSDRADAFAQRLLADQVEEEVQQVYQNARDIFDLGPDDIQKHEESVDADQFRYMVSTGQSEADFQEAYITRKIVLRVPHAELPENFDNIFATVPDEFVVPFPGSNGQFAELASRVAAAAKKIGAKERDNPTSGTIDMSFPDGTVVKIVTAQEFIVITCGGVSGCLPLIDHVSNGELGNFIGEPPPLIGSAE